LAAAEVSTILITHSFEPQEAYDALLNYSHSDFTADLAASSWLKFGFNSWLVYGNMDKDEAVSTVGNIQAKLNIQGAT
jgi:hypothetical protein